MLELEEGDGWVRFEVRVAPRAAREALAEHAGALKVALRAAPVDGEANAALVLLLAERLGVGRRDVRIVRGERARAKRVEIRGVTSARVQALVGGAR